MKTQILSGIVILLLISEKFQMTMSVINAMVHVEVGSLNCHWNVTDGL